MLVEDMLGRAVRLFGDQPALVDGETRLTYREVDNRARRLASGLQGLGLNYGDHVAILAHNSHKYMEAYLAAPMAGLVLAPVNTRLSSKETLFILDDGAIKALLVGREFLPLLKEIREKLPSLRHVVVLEGEGDMEMTGYDALLESSQPEALKPRAWAKDDMAFLCYTGGTTGLPKGVMLSQRNIVSNAWHAIQLAEFSDRDVWLHCCPMFHAADYWSCFVITMLGGFHVFMDRFEPRRLLELIQAHGVTTLLLVPTMINMVLDLPEAKDFDLSTLRRVLYGASPMPVDRLKAAISLFGPVTQHLYGQTESSPFLSSVRLRDNAMEGEDKQLRRLSSCGQEIVGVQLRVVNGDGQDVAPGEVGEVIARGPNVMLGYWNRPQETAETLVDGWLHTGDMATMDEDHYLFIMDRAKDMIITGGENVFSPEVENALYTHPAVREAAVIGIPDETWGEAVKAIVVLHEHHKATEEELIAHCHEAIAGYKCPKSIDFTDSLPKSGPGKILKSELRKPYWEGRERAVN